ncbi:phosphoadenylyl-sulfate reductase [Usitatibacter palustris]|uniref:Adenosine 5'-phosphosulfate reductase n=1 Tax=Usitatibacter palustris TaxID=2732487 RepID=A0A6M4H7K9_9PROT|nr:phosphoadenylyl-sulfate reductase [Usitatibacter palustris]QJR15596.1 Thioredoxin-dependent 5'-adenylylsulfate reductase [Usitatibacter palustris]
MSFEDRIVRSRRLLAAVEKNHSPAVFTSSFGAEDMVVLDLIARDGLAIEIATLDTGRLPKETLDLIAKVRHDYAIDITIHSPWPESIDAYIEEYGIDGFYDGIEQRKACCAVRKVEPLNRALAGKRAWVTGLRREQSDSRAKLVESEADTARRLWKFNPLVEWTDEDVWQYLRLNSVPWNKLHDRGYPSIGCEPCTRAVRQGEHPRAGRWWWEQEDAKKECGLHVIPLKEIA